MNFKHIFITALMSLASGGALAEQDTPPRPILIDAPIQQVFVPQGFDDNDNAQIVIQGAYPNSCYKVGHTSYSVDKPRRTIKVTVSAYHTPDTYCLMVYVPFTEVVSVGVLEKGTYQVEVNHRSDPATVTLPVAQARLGTPDDYTYAPVSEAFFASKKKLVIRGELTNSCLSIREVRSHEESGKVIAVLPIVEYRDDGHCRAERRPYTTEVELKPSQTGTYLIHVRSLNGQSLNHVVHF